MSPGRRPRHPAIVARVLTAGLSLAAALGMVAAMARDSQRRVAPASSARTVEVRIGGEVSDPEARAALRAWLEGQPDLDDRDGSVTVVDSPPDTTTAPS